ncbi:epoxide hydrolase [Colletotrichum gloeosporioides Cg-14]|uniref:Epoxide hydrolase n=1 Tax=Colletotrichum gloeosporioides (strain Cg-14) TaxID=1237896 RepID=T0KAG7_COLGC|nr:epoxide hydrolase [Colletotrichum gloeosporioides Cg-14]
MSFEPRPFDFHFTKEDIDDLRSRLKNTRLPTGHPGSVLEGWDYGVDLGWLQQMVARWQNGMDIEGLEAKLKKWPHFQVKIEDVGVHFLHVRSKREEARPLLLVHGWPGSFYEFKNIIDKLADPGDGNLPAFHVVVPSLPGYAFSQAPTRRGWTMEDTARVFNKLMVGLGYRTYMAQGGDWGHQVCRYLGSLHSETCKLVHLNMCPAPPPVTYRWLLSSWMPAWLRNIISPRLFSPVEEALCQRSLTFAKTGFGYAQLQGTKPGTLGYSLLDSPIGHLAWLGEKWMAWSDTESPSEHLFAESSSDTLLSDDILANVTIYWFTRSILTSFLPYLENRDANFEDYRILNLTMVTKPEYYIKVPFGLSSFKFELAGSTRAAVAKTGNLVYYKEHAEGGHFAALDRPAKLLEDMYAFYETVACTWKD